jgi:hypothetical protein
MLVMVVIGLYNFMDAVFVSQMVGPVAIILMIKAFAGFKKN